MIAQPIPECDLVVKGVINNRTRGWLMQADGLFASDLVNEAPLSRAELSALANTAGRYLTFMCVPWGSGERIGVDRDLDGVLDGDEN